LRRLCWLCCRCRLRCRAVRASRGSQFEPISSLLLAVLDVEVTLAAATRAAKAAQANNQRGRPCSTSEGGSPSGCSAPPLSCRSPLSRRRNPLVHAQKASLRSPGLRDRCRLSFLREHQLQPEEGRNTAGSNAQGLNGLGLWLVDGHRLLPFRQSPSYVFSRYTSHHAMSFCLILWKIVIRPGSVSRSRCLASSSRARASRASTHRLATSR
jgi:hypothetical protein